MAVFKLNTTDGGQFNFSLKNDADKTLVKSEQYNTKAAAENGIESVKNNADNAARYDAKASDSGKFYFNLKAGNGQIIGTSPMFADAAARDAANTVKAGGFDPAQESRVGQRKAAATLGEGFELVAREGYAKRSLGWSSYHQIRESGVATPSYVAIA